MTRPAAKGWCPGAYQPMMSGDGLVVRVRPVMARFSRDQALGLCDLAMRFGSGLMDLTSRANVQIRGVSEGDHEALLEALNGLGLLPDDPDLEARRNVLVAPDWVAGDDTDVLARQLLAQLGELPDLPAKFGFAVDCGAAPVLGGCSADIRIERAADGLIVRADGAALGRAVSVDTAVDQAIALARWFADSKDAATKRMKRHIAETPLPAEWGQHAALPAREPLTAGAHTLGAVYGAAFGQIEAAQLADLIKDSGCDALRVTPWRLFLTEGAAPVNKTAFVMRADDPLLNIDACPGAPLCGSASVETRALAASLAGRTPLSIHLSGCSKGCARPRAAEITLVGRDGAFDLVRNGTPWEEPVDMGLTPKEITDRIGEF